MKIWHIVALCVLSIIVLLFSPTIVRAGLIAWPNSALLPIIHYDCKDAIGVVLVRIELNGYVTKDFRIDCRPV
jgi:hypothetical protein